MKTWVRKTLSVGVLAAGALLLAPAAAQADVNQDSYDNNGILNGTQLVAPINVPVSVVGNAIGVAGEANAAGGVHNWLESGRGVDQDSYDNNGIANGTQAYLPINVPVSVVGNAVGVLGEANAAGAVVNGRKTESKKHHKGGDWDGPNQTSYDNNGILNGTQLYAPVDIPINVCGNSLGLFGEANAACVVFNGKGHRHHRESGKVDQDSYDNNGIANGTQIYAPLSLPVNLAGNAIGILGEGNAAAAIKNESGHGGKFDQDSYDNNGILNGTQLAAPIDIPINVCGNALGLLGEANAGCVVNNGGSGHGGHGHGGHGHGGHGDHDGDHDGDNDGDYDGDGDGHGNGGYNDHDDVDGDGGADNDGYGAAKPDAYGDAAGGREVQGKKAEQSPVSGVTGALGGVGATNLGGIDLLNTLR
jgi:hypothetical protein